MCRGWSGRLIRESFLGNPGLAQAIENRLELGKIRHIVAPRRPVAASAADGEGRVKREAGLDRSMRFLQSTRCASAAANRKCAYGWFRLASMDR